MITESLAHNKYGIILILTGHEFFHYNFGELDQHKTFAEALMNVQRELCVLVQVGACQS